MLNQPTMFQIIETLKATGSTLSAKGIAVEAEFEATSENLRWIQDECFDLVNSGKAEHIEVDGPMGGHFFKLNEQAA